ncbi:zinc finger protein ZAT5-like [Phalaenopsis equestris]|uniref:zinc finger protein ZAT5-like n=1 Tax=Phalaenopsis equestris TaxID=78828 RepID=UPI0009E3E2B7|nr:zinc finger protein ZAT5-like [Phalaenopsis equestris]
MEESTKLKGKRTKRKRNHLLPPIVSSILSPTPSAEISESTTEEEEDMANCLLLLAEGGYNPKPNEMDEATTAVNMTSRQYNAGNNVHQCRDCNMCFSSHQALGGHRASHNKKLKLSIPLVSEVMNVNSIQLSINSFSSPAKIEVKTHKCWVCEKEFSSGQALGGHMRKHRLPTSAESTKKKENFKRFYLDLNLPPPCDD